jgi:membrane associated rhomboid family serine protease
VAESHSADDYCYRHPKRVSYVLCQRCGNTICGDCQIPAAVGVHCPDCAKEARKNQPKIRRTQRDSAPVTFGLLGVMAVVYLGQLVTSGALTNALLYWPPLTVVEPWRMLTSLFVHSESSFFHILFNGYSLFVLGTLLERLLGSSRFFWLFMVSGLGGSTAVLWLAPGSAVVGASGAIFGLFGALLVIQRSFGVTNPQLMIVLGINLVMGFVVPGISWQAHVGGLLTGLMIAWGLVKARESHQKAGTVGIFALVIGVIVVATIARFVLA